MVTRPYHGRTKYRGAEAWSYEARRASQRRWAVEQAVVEGFVAGLSPSSSVLDVPFGTGRFVPIYLARGLDVHGVDVSPDMLLQARAHLGVRWAACTLAVGDAEALPYGDGAVGSIVCHRFLKWLPDLGVVESVLGEMARVASRRILVQAKLARASPAPSGEASDKAEPALRGGSPAIRGDIPGDGPTRYRDADLRQIFERVGLRLEQALDVPAIGPNIRYYLLRAGA